LEEIKRISLIGSGNVASHLGRQLHNNGFEIVQVYSRNLAHANRLAEELESQAVNHISYINSDADLYLFSLKDDAYEEVLKEWTLKDVPMAHTSGSLEGSILKNHSENYAVFYPFQSFSRARKLDWNNLPLFVNASQAPLLKAMIDMGQSIGARVVQLDHAQRKSYHLAAVFANNFVNRLYHISQEICDQEELDFDLLRPLIMETANKVMDSLPSEMQTGPAKRVDLEVLNMHYSSMSGDPDKQKVYQILSESIIKAQKDHD